MGFLELSASAALFDMDGTLVDSTAVVETVWRDFCREHDVDESVLVPWSHGRRTTDTVRHFLPDVTGEEVQSISQELQGREQATLTGIVAIPGAAALLANLEMPWAVVTSATRELAVRRMRAAGLPEPRVLVPADEIGNGKPHPEGYLRAAELLGVPIDECLVFEDAEPGLRAALDSGARVVVVGAVASAYADGLNRVYDLSRVRLSRR